MCGDKCNLIFSAEIKILETKQNIEVEMEFPPDISLLDEKMCEFQSNGAPVPEERCAHSNANGVAVPFQTA